MSDDGSAPRTPAPATEVRRPAGLEPITGPVVISGLGLIGGSLARDLAAAGVPVFGIDRDREACDAAVREGVLRGSLAAGDPLPADAALAVVAAPVSAATAVLEDLARSAGPDVVFTDVCSTKRTIEAAAAALGVGRRFVGAHPVAGDHRSGWKASRRGLFASATVWICPGEADDAAVARVVGLWTAIGAVPRLADAALHDRLLARASHMPQVIASALAGALAHADIEPGALGPGGRDTTRLAASSADLWTGILLDNADEVLSALDGLASRLDALAAALRRRDQASVLAWLAEAADWRRQLG